ncbi:hypothetical protein HDU97_008190 [Phlyctochytrium planicorne]|nr:hypothetical protein HDU97_008190 [Phlyctochytrium planicorne]
MFKLKVNPDDSPIISLVRKPLVASGTSPPASGFSTSPSSSPTSSSVNLNLEGGDGSWNYGKGFGGSHRGLRAFDGGLGGARKSDPFATDVEGVRPFCLAIKSPSQLSKYLVHWLQPNYTTDVYQVGREPGPGVDMVVPGASYLQTGQSIFSNQMYPGPVPIPAPSNSPILTSGALNSATNGTTLLTSGQSRFPFRLVCERGTSSGNPGTKAAAAAASELQDVRLFAGAFDAAGRLILGGKEVRFTDDLGRVDALVGNSVLVWRPDWSESSGVPNSAMPLLGMWMEVSAVYGNPYGLRNDPCLPGKRLVGLCDGKDGTPLGKEAIIYAGGSFFLWKSGGGDDDDERDDRTVKAFLEMLKTLEEKVICPVTLDTIQTDHVAESIRGRSLKPWDRLVARLRWLNSSTSFSPTTTSSSSSFIASGLPLTRSPSYVSTASAPTPVPVRSASFSAPDRDHLPNFSPFATSGPVPTISIGDSQEDGRSVAGDSVEGSNGGIVSEEEVATGRPWVFIRCGHVVSFIDIPTFFHRPANANSSPTSPNQNPSTITTPCFVCRTPSRFVPLIARLNPYLLEGFSSPTSSLTPTATHCFDPCGHMIDEQGALKWGKQIVVPRVGKDPRVWDSEPVCGPSWPAFWPEVNGVSAEGDGGQQSRRRSWGAGSGSNVSIGEGGLRMGGALRGESMDVGMRPRAGSMMVGSGGLVGQPSLSSSSSSSSLGMGGHHHHKSLRTQWGHICPFCASEIVAVRKLYWSE